MSDNDENNVLKGTVDEVKQAVRDMEDPDYTDLLQREENGKDRKTVKDFLAKKADGQEVELTDSENEEEEENRQQVEDDEFDSSKLMLAGVGVVIGLLIGLAAGQMVGGDTSGNPELAANNVEEIITGGNFNGTVDVGSPRETNGMYYFNVSITQDTPNGTQTSYQPAYVSKDGVLLFPEVQSFMLTSPINMEEQIARQQQAPQNGSAPAS